jgi:3-deoxy-manno-octulosonate cytidylyltransferase (CMP-KDO synthetase)
MTLKKALGVIPVRFHSTRFPGKPLAPILGKPMIQWVFEGAKKAKYLDRVIIATDNERIFRTAEKIGAEVMMTSAEHLSGTERVAEVAAKVEVPIVINIQGDEPLVDGPMLDGLVDALQDGSVPMATLMAKNHDLSRLEESHIVKVIVDKNNDALYFSRAPLPYQAVDFFYQHIGIYGYQRDFLLDFNRLSPSRLESAEKLEQLRVLENGLRIKMIEIPFTTLSVDTPHDIIKVEYLLKKRADG